MIRDFFLGFIKIHVLYHASEGPVYGAEMARELQSHGYDVSPGTLYPTLHGLEQSGYLSSEGRVVEGRRRKYYRITPRGQTALAEARARIAELVDEVLGE
ncbi:MAG: PadR family transcriptional regulator [Chloroflexota bacterium]|nr:PadR family transcriptional regulator [Chloroflexota bacterium]